MKVYKINNNNNNNSIKSQIDSNNKYIMKKSLNLNKL